MIKGSSKVSILRRESYYFNQLDSVASADKSFTLYLVIV